jgi:hypothetical protein
MESFMEVGQGPNVGCSAKGKKIYILHSTTQHKNHDKSRHRKRKQEEWSADNLETYHKCLLLNSHTTTYVCAHSNTSLKIIHV